MNLPIDKVLGEGNCGEATDRGEEAGTKAARLRTETSYKAGSTWRACPSMRSRSQLVVQVNDEPVQRNITHLSGEICTDGTRAVVAPASRACPKPWNASVETEAGGVEVTDQRSTKISDKHLQKMAYVYLRQSSMGHGIVISIGCLTCD